MSTENPIIEVSGGHGGSHNDERYGGGGGTVFIPSISTKDELYEFQARPMTERELEQHNASEGTATIVRRISITEF